jgi:hypothetical protein
LSKQLYAPLITGLENKWPMVDRLNSGLVMEWSKDNLDKMAAMIDFVVGK